MQTVSLPEGVAERLRAWFSLDYEVLWGWCVSINGLYIYFLAVHQYEYLYFMRIAQHSDKQGYDIQRNSSTKLTKLDLGEAKL